MAGGQPFMYNAPARYSAIDPYNGFNPKSVTQASVAPRPAPRPKPEGPLLNFNRHPDSWQAAPYGQLNYTPMHRHTRSRVAVARYSQQALRCLQLLAAVGVLICVIAIKGTNDNEGWIIRVPPATDILASIYAIYHLARPGAARPPASSASYHFFALCIDAGLIPFFVFTAMLAKQNLDQDPNTDDRWRTYFTGDDATNKTLFSTYIMTIVGAALHSASFVLSLYLVISFRRIARLPPDMNPLEDNLTSRRKSKHKHKNSSMSEASTNRFSQALSNRFSGLTESSSKRDSARDSMFSVKEPSRMSFFQSRAGNDMSFSAHNPRTAHQSRVDLSQQIYERTRRASNDSVGDWGDLLPPGAVIDTHSRRLSAMPSIPTMSKRNSAVLTPTQETFNAKEMKRRSDTQQELQTDNWFVVGQTPLDSETGTLNDAEDDNLTMDPNSDDYDPYRTATPDAQGTKRSGIGKLYKANTSYAALPRQSLDEVDYEQQPLRMNPPTPPHQGYSHYLDPEENTYSPHQHQQQRVVSPLQETTGNRSHTMNSAISAVTASSQYSEGDTTMLSTSSANTPFTLAPKGRFYGDLASAMRGVRLQGGDDHTKSMVGSVHHVAFENGGYAHKQQLPPVENLAPVKRGLTRYSPGKTRPKRYMESVTGTVVKKAGTPGEEDEENDARYAAYNQAGGNAARVVSRSGADFMDAGSDIGLNKGRREVSGKVAEEGRGGWGSGLYMRKVSGMA